MCARVCVQAAVASSKATGVEEICVDVATLLCLMLMRPFNFDQRCETRLRTRPSPSFFLNPLALFHFLRFFSLFSFLNEINNYFRREFISFHREELNTISTISFSRLMNRDEQTRVLSSIYFENMMVYINPLRIFLERIE